MTSSILHPTAELLALLLAHPDLPILYLYGDESDHEGEVIAEHARYSLSRVVTYLGDTYVEYDTLEEEIERKLWETDFSEDVNELYLEADRRAKAIWAEALPCILVEVW